MARPVLIFVDTNIAIQQSHFFFKKQGPELLATMRRAGARLLLPEVLRREYVTNFVLVGRTARQTIETGDSLARSFFDLPIGRFFPSDVEVGDRAGRMLDQLQDLVTFIPETEALLLAAARRTMTNTPPCSKTDHGFKDCLIWESILSVAGGSELHIVTMDRAFFGGDKGDSLAPRIIIDAQAKGISITGHCGKDKPKDWSPLEGVLQAISPLVHAADPSALNVVDPQNAPAPKSPPGLSVPVGAPDRTDGGAERAPTSGTPEAQVAVEQNELDRLLAPKRAAFFKLDGTVLGVVAFLEGHDKNRLSELLAQMGIDRAHAQNAWERLTLAGLLKDTGHHLLPVGGRASELAAALVQEEVITLMRRNR